MPKRILRNALLMMVATFLMALGLLTYIHSTGSLPGGENPNSVLLHDGVYTSAQQGYLSESPSPAGWCRRSRPTPRAKPRLWAAQPQPSWPRS